MNGHLISTPAVLTPCTGCRSQILACHAAGFRTYANPQSLTAAAEIAARLDGLDAYDLIPWATRFYLEYRNLMRVTADSGYRVVAQHRCRNPGVGSRTPGMELSALWGKPKPKRKVMVRGNDNDQFPF